MTAETSEADRLRILQLTISILDQPDYAGYSGGEAHSYLDYFAGSRADEISLIHPVLFRNFCIDILGYTPGLDLYEEVSDDAGNRPDFIPRDRATHPFVFDTKGTDTADLRRHRGQINGYTRAHGLTYGVLINMRDVVVYAESTSTEVQDCQFSFTTLYRDAKRRDVLNRTNTQRFLRFVELFRHRHLSIQEKAHALGTRRPWTGNEDLHLPDLTQGLRLIQSFLLDDVQLQSERFRAALDALSADRRGRIERELQILRRELAGYSDKVGADPPLADFLDGQPGTEAALNAFFTRVAYFTVTRLLLVRFWGDIGFITQNILHNGDFARGYAYHQGDLHRILRHAYDLAAERYGGWLFSSENNYTWYEPRTDALVESLHILADFPLHRLDSDVLSYVYENYIDRVDKQQKGQYYTPRPLVRLMWELVGYRKKNRSGESQKMNLAPRGFRARFSIQRLDREAF